MFRCCPIEQVYNVTDFLEGHPGGEDLILMHGGKDVTEIMQDPLEHEHSEFAFDMLKDYFIGRVDTGLVRKDRCVICLHVTCISHSSLSRGNRARVGRLFHETVCQIRLRILIAVV
jgi:hypothetical protein